jgi:hypothetical protein
MLTFIIKINFFGTFSERKKFCLWKFLLQNLFRAGSTENKSFTFATLSFDFL